MHEVRGEIVGSANGGGHASGMQEVPEGAASMVRGAHEKTPVRHVDCIASGAEPAGQGVQEAAPAGA